VSCATIQDGEANDERRPDGHVTQLPSAEALSRACVDVIVRWHEHEPALDWSVTEASIRIDGDGLAVETARLCLVNCFQWHLEDECRASYDDHGRIAALKHAIDASNARRVRRIDELDERIVRDLAAPGENGTPALVTPGNLLDRISILELKRYHARGAAAAGIDEQLDDVRRGLDALFADIAAGRQRVKLYGTTKIYGT
jgi:hypothetical protein